MLKQLDVLILSLIFSTPTEIATNADFVSFFQQKY